MTRGTVNGEVYVNSGIPNPGFYGAAVAVGGFAWDIAGRIWYRALTSDITTDAKFHDAAIATLDASCELFGDHTSEYRAVKDAWSAVGVL